MHFDTLPRPADTLPGSAGDRHHGLASFWPRKVARPLVAARSQRAPPVPTRRRACAETASPSVPQARRRPPRAAMNSQVISLADGWKKLLEGGVLKIDEIL